MYTGNGANLKKKIITSLAATSNATHALLQLLTITSWLFSRNFNLKDHFSFGEQFFEAQMWRPSFRAVPQNITSTVAFGPLATV